MTRKPTWEREEKNTFADENKALRTALRGAIAERDLCKRALRELQERLGIRKPTQDRKLRSVT